MAPISQSITTSSRAVKTVLIVTKRDLVTSVTGNSGFSLIELDGALSPTNARLFSWLSSVAPSFDYIEWDSVKLEFISSSPTTAGGRVYMAADYNPSDPEPTSPTDFMNQQDSVSGGTWNSFSLKLSVRELKRFKRYFTHRSSQVPEPADSMPGKLFVAVDGTPAGKIGDLFIEYSVKLTVPSTPPDQTVENRMTVEFDNPDTDFTKPNERFGLGDNPINTKLFGPNKIITRARNPPFSLSTAASANLGEQLLPGVHWRPALRKLKLLLNVIEEIGRNGGAGSYLDIFQSLTAGGTVVDPNLSSYYNFTEPVIFDPDGTTAMTLSRSPVNAGDYPVFKETNNKPVSANYVLEFDPELVPKGKQVPLLSWEKRDTTLYSDDSDLGTVEGTPGNNPLAVRQKADSVSGGNNNTAWGLKKVIISTIDLGGSVIQ